MKHRVHLVAFILLFSSLIQASLQQADLVCASKIENGSIEYQIEVYGDNAYLKIPTKNQEFKSYGLKPFNIDEQTTSFDIKIKSKDYILWIDETSDLSEVTLIVMSDTKKRQSQEEYHFLSCDS